MKYCLLVSFFIFIQVLQCFSCPNGTIQGLTKDDCYYIGPYATLWDDAEKHCIEQGGHLTSIQSAFENAFVMNISQSIGYSNTGDSIFLGASDGLVGYINKNDQNHGEVWNWTWTDATAFGIYANWESGEPSLVHKDQYKLLMMRVSTGKWFTVDTDDEQLLNKYYICKVPPVNPNCPSLSPEYLMSVYYKELKKCYQIIVDTITLNDTIQQCIGAGYKLAKIRNMKENLAIATMLGYYYDNYEVLIGLQVNPSTQTWEWVDGSPLNYTNWDNNIVPSTSINTCGTIDPKYFGTWNGENTINFCDHFFKTKAGVCELDVNL